MMTLTLYHRVTAPGRNLNFGHALRPLILELRRA
jgi:hypothetical protein